MARWLWIALLCAASPALALLFIAAPAAAQSERITAFESQVTIDFSGEIEVTETITVEARGKQIRRGIFRDFPRERGRYWYGAHRVRFDVLEVLRNGQPESWRLESRGYSDRLYIGDANRLLRPGQHTFTIRYITDRQVGFFSDHDELIWNVTGNFWAFPIDSASATIQPPDGRSITSISAATGTFGATGQDAVIDRMPSGGAVVKTTRALDAREGLTVSVSLPAGSVIAPTASQRLSYLWRDGAPIWAGLFGLIIVITYYGTVWVKYGKDPDAGTIIPLYEPPPGLGPAACRYILNMGWDAKGFTAAIVNLAAKGFVRISEFEQDKFKLTRTSISAKRAKLTPGEMAVALKLFGEKLWTSFVFRSEHHAITDGARTSLRRSLKEDFESIYFFKNKALLTGGALLSALTLGAMAAVNVAGIEMGAFALTLALLSFALYPLLLGIWTGWNRGEGGVITLSATSAVGIMIAVNVVGNIGEQIVDWLLSAATIQAALVALVIGSNLLFYHLLKAPSRLGRRVMDDIEGFRLYLSVAEKDRMNFHNPPDVTPEIFERYLPFAIALDVENEWGEQFDLALDRVGGQTWSGDYEPTWFHSAYRGWSSPKSFATDFAPTFGQSVVSSLSPPGGTRGSGLSGGGFSGGGFSGGGGGGGGGW